MRYFIKKRSEILKKAAFGSALFMVSAFAMYMPEVQAKGNNKVKVESLVPDSIFTARSVFEKMHCSALEILPKSTRLDMLDYWDADSVYKASNAMEGLSWIEAIDRDYLKVRITEVSVFEIKILPVKKGKIVMTISTVGDDRQAQDSRISFYDENLTVLPTEKYFSMPKVRDFFDIPKGSTTSYKELEDMIPFPTVALSAFPHNDNLEARLTVEQYINQDDWNIAKLFVKPSITFEWEKDKYRLTKK